MPGGTKRRGAIPFDIPSWVPPGAADAIAWRAMLPGMKARDRALLERLATADAMCAVWPKLAAADTEKIVSVILQAEEEASRSPSPLLKRKDLAICLQTARLIPPSFLGVALLVEKAVQDMRELEVNLRGWLPYLWPGEPDMTFDRLLLQLNATAKFCRRLDAENKKAAAEADPLPAPPRKRGSRSAKQIYFGLILSDYFKRIGGSPLDDIVGAITGVVFDDASGGPDAETVRGRRRSARRRKADQA